ncbi:glycoside hydrolase family 16 protein [Chitinophaga sp. 22536]|uniref:glycoside hydrolase family 16 protein n=1 Tax=unclassified Chitinophaga TaxID=2619133 RepID=UPI003F83DFE4
MKKLFSTSTRIIAIIALSAIVFASCQKSMIKPEDGATTKKLPDEKPAAALTAGTINFSGYTWTVRATSSGTQGPGPNYWNSNNAWLDANGYLHLKMQKDAQGRWSCAEVTSNNNFGYGTYQWKVECDLNIIDRNIVLGLFNYSGQDGYDEQDVELSRWGNPSAGQFNYTVYPAQSGVRYKNVHWESPNITMNGTYTTHRFTRYRTDSIVYESQFGHYDAGSTIARKKFTSSDIKLSALNMPILMNLWLMNGTAPVNGQSYEVIIHEFKFTPLP